MHSFINPERIPGGDFLREFTVLALMVGSQHITTGNNAQDEIMYRYPKFLQYVFKFIDVKGLLSVNLVLQ